MKSYMTTINAYKSACRFMKKRKKKKRNRFVSGNWQKNWFLDGKKAVLEHRDDGLTFITTASKIDKRVDRAPFDSQHANLWTRKEFSGDIRISYNFSKMADSSWQKLIYIQARGIGQKPYVEDIYAWRDLRTVARMDKYYKYINYSALIV